MENNFEGTECNISPRSSAYSYQDTLDTLAQKYDFAQIGQGGFGVILANDTCAIKIVKDISRCDEMKREKRIYKIIQSKLQRNNFGALVPQFHIMKQLDSFCHFNMERILSPTCTFSLRDDKEEEDGDEDDDKYVYVIDSDDENYTIRLGSSSFKSTRTQETVKVKKDLVNCISRPGKLIHFYINHFDPDLNETLQNGQGILMGHNLLLSKFGVENVEKFIFDIGKLLSFLIFECRIVPVDIEVVLGTTALDRVVRPYIFDFNESYIFMNTVDVEKIARAMFGKNGKNYFPSLSRNKELNAVFARGFVCDIDSKNLKDASLILHFLQKVQSKTCTKIQ